MRVGAGIAAGYKYRLIGRDLSFLCAFSFHDVSLERVALDVFALKTSVRFGLLGLLGILITLQWEPVRSDELVIDRVDE